MQTQLPDLKHLLGAISYFYQQPISKADGLSALTAFLSEGRDDTPVYEKISKFVGGMGPAPKYHELMGDFTGDSYLGSIQYVKPKPGVTFFIRAEAYPEGWTKGQYKILFIF